MTTIMTGDVSENGRTSAIRDMAEGSKPRTISAAIKGLFKDVVKAITHHADDEFPSPRRRSDETEGEFKRMARYLWRRFEARGQFKEAGKERAVRTVRTIILSPEEWDVSDAHLTNTLDLLHQWNDDMANDTDYGVGFDSNQNYIYPHF